MKFLKEKGTIISIVCGVLDYAFMYMTSATKSDIFVYLLLVSTLIGLISWIIGFKKGKKTQRIIGIGLNIAWIIIVILAKVQGLV